MKYSEIIGVGKHFKEAFDITSDSGEAWKTFISNERFEGNLSQIIKSFTSPVFNNRKSIWIQGTYGTGKSHSLAVIKHLLCDDYDNIEDYIPKISRIQVRSSLTAFRKDKRVFLVVLKGTYNITDVADLTYAIQQQVAVALGDIEISTKTDFQSALQLLENGTMDSFFENLLDKNIELHSYAQNKQQLAEALRRGEKKVIRIIADELKRAGLGGFRTYNIVEWLTEVKNELKRRGIADYLLIMWDEFTSLLDIPASRSILNVMQDIAELSRSEVSGSDEGTLGIYLLLVTHKKLEVTTTYKELKEDERNMAKARFVELDYGMQPTTTFHILSAALDRKQPDKLKELVQENFLDVPSVKKVVDAVVDPDTVNASDIKEKIVSLYPFHPYTSYLATFVSRVVGEAERSIFGFLNDDVYGFKKFIQSDTEEKKFLTADYVWDYFYQYAFEKAPAGHFDTITNKFKLAGESVAAKGADYAAVFKTILLLNILYRVTTTDGDSSEKNMVTPSENNILAAYSGALSESEVRTILDYIDENQIIHRNPDGIFEVASSALPQKKILEEKKKLYPGKEDVSKIVEGYSVSCLGKLEKSLSMNIPRETDIQVFWGGEKEHLLRGKLVSKFAESYTAHIAVLLYRGETQELDRILGRSEQEQIDSKNIILHLSQEEEFRDIVFVLANTELGNRRFEAYLDCLAQETVARTLQMEQERIEGERTAEKWIAQWMDEIVASGMADIVFRGDVLRIPFAQCSRHLKESYIPTIFRFGLDTLPVANTAWKHQMSKKAVELVLYRPSKSELERDASGADAAVKSLLVSGNQVLFDEQLELVSEDESIPIVKVCKEVRNLLEKRKNETSINLAEEFRYLTKPQFGYYRNRLFMGAFGLAMRPYINRLYTSGDGRRIDKTVMKDVVVDIFTYWENNNKYSDKFVVRMSTEEERELTEKLKMVFAVTDQDGLMATKWAIRDKFKQQSKAPLWALKYVGQPSEKYKKFIDKMFKFSKSTDESIQQSFIVELLEGIKTFDVELSEAVASVQDSQCLDTYILEKLQENAGTEEDLQEVKAYLDGQMSGDLVFWEEEDVQNQIIRFLLEKERRRSESAASAGREEGESVQSGTESAEIPEAESHDGREELHTRVRSKIEAVRGDSETLYKILVALTEKYAGILGDIDELL